VIKRSIVLLFLFGLGVVYIYFLPELANNELNSAAYLQMLTIAVMVIVYAVLLLLLLSHKNKFNPLRQIFSVTFDILLFSYCLYMAGEWGTIFIALFLWIIIGNGIRFGLPYLIYAMFLGLVSFAIILNTTVYWSHNQILGLGILISIMLLPSFFIFLIKRLHKTKHELELELKKTTYLANHDLLTGLPNRHSFNNRLHQELQRAKRNQTSFSILYMDLDGFKMVNDSYGHDVGDKLLIEIARRVQSCVREIDHIARIGGDEFVCVTAAGKVTEHPEHLKQRLQETINKPVQIDEVKLEMRVSIGEALYPDDGTEFEQLLIKSDHNMYEQKLFNRK